MNDKFERISQKWLEQLSPIIVAQHFLEKIVEATFEEFAQIYHLF